MKSAIANRDLLKDLAIREVIFVDLESPADPAIGADAELFPHQRCRTKKLADLTSLFQHLLLLLAEPIRPPSAQSLVHVVTLAERSL